MINWVILDQKRKTYFKKFIIRFMGKTFLIFLPSMINFWTKNHPKRITIISTLIFVDHLFIILFLFPSMLTLMIMEIFSEENVQNQQKILNKIILLIIVSQYFPTVFLNFALLKKKSHIFFLNLMSLNFHLRTILLQIFEAEFLSRIRSQQCTVRFVWNWQESTQWNHEVKW